MAGTSTTKTAAKAAAKKTAAPTPPVLDLQKLEDAITVKVMAAVKDHQAANPVLTETRVEQIIASSPVDMTDIDAKVDVLQKKAADAEDVAKKATDDLAKVQAAMATKISRPELEGFVEAKSDEWGMSVQDTRDLVQGILQRSDTISSLTGSVSEEMLREVKDGEDAPDAQKRLNAYIAAKTNAAEVEQKLDELEHAREYLISEEGQADMSQLLAEMMRSRYAMHRIDEPGVGFGAAFRRAGLGIRNVYLEPVGHLPRIGITYGVAFLGVSLVSSTVLANQAWAQHWVFRFSLPLVAVAVNEIIAWRVRAAYYGDDVPEGPQLRAAERKERKAERKAEKEAKKEARKAKKA